MTLIDRTGAAALIPPEYAREIIEAVPESSAVLQLARRLPNMSRYQMELPVLSALIDAHFPNGEPTNADNTKGFIQPTAAAWQNVTIYAAEVAAIVPIPRSVLNDAQYDIWDQIRPRIPEAFGKAIDAAILYGTNKPTTWPTPIFTGATNAGHVVPMGSVGTDLYDDLFSEDGVIAKVEEDGFFVTGHIGALALRSKLRGLRDGDDRPMFNAMMQDRPRYALDGVEVVFPRNGAVNPAASLLISGDFSQLVYSIREDVSLQILTEATIYDTDGQTVLYALAQQNMVALRAVMRLGWQLPNPVNRVNTDNSTRYPFAVLAPAAAGSGSGS